MNSNFRALIFLSLLTSLLISCEKSIHKPETNKSDAQDITTPYYWRLSSIPVRFPESALINDLASGYNRSKLAWYTINTFFLRDYIYAPDHIKYDYDQLSSNLIREISEREIFPNRSQVIGEFKALEVLNIAFYPSERGPYNYDSEKINSEGELSNPTQRWGGIVRNIESSSFNKFVEFWLMDPFIESNSSSFSRK